MAKMFYSLDEATVKLGTTEEALKDMVRAGKLREFRDAGTFNYKVDEIDRLMAESTPVEATSSSGSASGEIILEAADDSGVELSGSGTDVISLDGTDIGGSMGGTAGGTASATASGTAGGTSGIQRAKGDTAVPSVGINVFDDEDLDEHVDPLAQTAITDVAGLGLDAAGSGSGILDLTRESDDTSLGQELLDEIYTDDESVTDDSAKDGDATRAGIEVDEDDEVLEEVDDSPQDATAVLRTVRQVVEYGPDALSSALTAMMVVAMFIMLVGGLAAAALVRGISPSLLEAAYAHLWIYASAAVVVTGGAFGVTFALGRKNSG